VNLRDTEPESRAEARRLLDEAASLIGRGWCQGALAVDGDDRRVEPWSESARRWSPLGALLRAWYARPSPDAEPFRLAYTALANATGGRLEDWNAARWRARRHVLSAFGRARLDVPASRPGVEAASGDRSANLGERSAALDRVDREAPADALQARTVR
jgi:hypothetical protein